MPNVAGTDSLAGLTSPANPMPLLQLATKLCSACSRPLTIQDTQQRPMISAATTRASLCRPCDEKSKAEGDRLIGRNRANSSKSPSQSIPLPLAPPTPDAVAPSSVSNDRGRSQIPIPFTPSSSRNPSQDARSISISPTPTSYFLSRIRSPTALASPLGLHTSTVDPLVDITRLRVRSPSTGCLYPGETFLGIQTNQGKEHKVSVTILVSGSLTLSVFVCYTRTIHEKSMV